MTNPGVDRTDRRGADRITRRSVLAGTGALSIAALAGCTGGSDGGDGTGGSTETDHEMGGDMATSDDGAGTTAGDAHSLEDHPAAADLASQPTRGPDPFEAEAVIVAFEDPSCPRCRAFETETAPRIESELVADGTASFVFRGYPVIYPWGEPATQALESTYAADAEAFWALKDHYFAEQSSFTESNVLDLTRSFLADETDVDADAVVSDAESMGHDAAVQADLDAGMNAGASRTTPHVFLFKDGEYVTKAAGSVSFSVVTNALGL